VQCLLSWQTGGTVALSQQKARCLVPLHWGAIAASKAEGDRVQGWACVQFASVKSPHTVKKQLPHVAPSGQSSSTIGVGGSEPSSNALKSFLNVVSNSIRSREPGGISVKSLSSFTVARTSNVEELSMLLFMTFAEATRIPKPGSIGRRCITKPFWLLLVQWAVQSTITLPSESWLIVMKSGVPTGTKGACPGSREHANWPFANVQAEDVQSSLVTQRLPSLHDEHEDPPQSTSDSVPSTIPLEQEVHNPLVH
jgi:hypothetical protein